MQWLCISVNSREYSKGKCITTNVGAATEPLRLSLWAGPTAVSRGQQIDKLTGIQFLIYGVGCRQQVES